MQLFYINTSNQNSKQIQKKKKKRKKRKKKKGSIDIMKSSIVNCQFYYIFNYLS